MTAADWKTAYEILFGVLCVAVNKEGKKAKRNCAIRIVGNISSIGLI